MPKRILQGVVVSDKQEKTLVVKVERRFTHPLLKKTVRRTKNYHAHVENKTQKVGDTVSIEETKPISKLKRWIVINEAAPKDMRGARRRASIHPGGDEPPSEEVRRRKGPETDLNRKAIRP